MEIFEIPILELTVIVAIAVCTVAFVYAMHKISRQPERNSNRPTERNVDSTEPEEDRRKEKVLTLLDKMEKLTEET